MSSMWVKWKSLWVVVLMVILLEAGRGHGCLEKERIALLQLKSFFNLLPWKNGITKDSDCCQWQGVRCNITTGRVIAVNLYGERMGDPSVIDASLFLPLEELKAIDLGGNAITDIVWPSEMNTLEELHLNDNHLNNSFLLNLKGFSSLKTLWLGGNNLKGSIDIGGFYDLTSLEELRLSYNAIESIQSSQELRLVNLKVLSLSYNLVNSTVFTQLGGFPNLKILGVGANRFNGSINITELASLRNLEELDLSLNELNEFVSQSGEGSTMSLGKLTKVYLNYCFKQRHVPLIMLLQAFPFVKLLSLKYNDVIYKTMASKDIHLLSNVEELYLDGSPLNVNFLETIGALTSLQVLSLSDCSFNGVLTDQGWCYLKNLQELLLYENAIMGAIPSCLSNLTSLRYLDISYNKFTGNVAHTSLTNLTRLQGLLISNNYFQIPFSYNSFANHSKLKVLLSDENQLVTEPATTLPITTSPQLQLKAFSAAYGSIQGQTIGLPHFLYFQNDLRYLHISRTNFDGVSFPVWLIENNTRLEQLYMIDNSFMGPVLLPSRPHPLLSVMAVSNNNITSQIPTDICLLFPNLQWLILSRVAFQGKIPSCLGGMSSLSLLDLSFNQLFGEIPVELVVNTSLSYLRLSNNNFSGKLPPQIFWPNELTGLFLDGNAFEGELPHLPTNAQVFLQFLNLSNNHFSGKIPSWIWNMPFVKTLALSKNNLEGTILKESCMLGSLVFLDLSQNNLYGSIPSCFNPPNLKQAHLAKNKFNGSMTYAFYNSSSLVTLDLGDNMISGEIPDWIGNISTLRILLLKANKLTGEIPTQLCQLQLLSIVDLSQNKLSGHIPTCLNKLTLVPSNMKFFTALQVRNGSSSLDQVIKDIGLPDDNSHFHENSWNFGHEEIAFTTKKGSYSYMDNILDYFSGIDLSCNQLTGPIPIELGNLSEIRALNLSHNNLSGSIPSTFSKLKQIESLDLSYNNLDGRIPTQLTELTTLEMFTVAHNNLSGPLPNMKAQFGTFEESSYEGNPLLCGPPLKNSCTKGDQKKSSSHSSGEEEKDGYIEMGDFYISFVVSYAIIFLTTGFVLYINPYWRRTWFYFIEECSLACYYFIVDTLHKFPCFRRRHM